MASVNKKTITPAPVTHGGTVASRISPFLQLRRSVMATMLFEDNFYESGDSVVERIKTLIPQCDPQKVANLAIDTRKLGNLRHVPMLLVREMARLPSHKHLVADTLYEIICRADELAEFVAIYWKDGKQPLSAQVKKGLARAFTKFNEYALAKYNRDKDITLRDVLFLCHATPKDNEQAALWKKLINNELETPDTWEVELSKSKDKKASWERLITDKKLGGLATLRNLRNMKEAGVSLGLIKTALNQANYSQVLPFRFVAAAIHNPSFESSIEYAMLTALASNTKLPGRTILVLDISGSMGVNLSSKSEMTRYDAACALAIILREVCENVTIYATAGNDRARRHATDVVPDRRGFALRDAVRKMNATLSHGGIFLSQCVDYIFKAEGLDKSQDMPERLIVLTDEQDCSGTKLNPNQTNAFGKRNYLINIASDKNGIGYDKWTHVDGFSEAVVRFISEFENITE
jgi:hypothetical protein